RYVKFIGRSHLQATANESSGQAICEGFLLKYGLLFLFMTCSCVPQKMSRNADLVLKICDPITGHMGSNLADRLYSTVALRLTVIWQKWYVVQFLQHAG